MCDNGVGTTIGSNVIISAEVKLNQIACLSFLSFLCVPCACVRCNVNEPLAFLCGFVYSNLLHNQYVMIERNRPGGHTWPICWANMRCFECCAHLTLPDIRKNENWQFARKKAWAKRNFRYSPNICFTLTLFALECVNWTWHWTDSGFWKCQQHKLESGVVFSVDFPSSSWNIPD